MEAVNRLVADLQPDVMCFQKVRTKGDFLIQVPGYMGWLGTMDNGLFGGVSTYLRHGLPFDMEAQRGDIPEWLLETIVLPFFRPAECGFKSRISRQCEPDSSLG